MNNFRRYLPHATLRYRSRGNEHRQPLIDGHINNEMYPVVVATINDRVRIAEAKVPALSLGHENSPIIKSEIDCRITGDGDVQPSDPVLSLIHI